MPISFSQTQFNCSRCGGVIPAQTNYMFAPHKSEKLCNTCHPIPVVSTSGQGSAAPTPSPAASTGQSTPTTQPAPAPATLAPQLANAQNTQTTKSATPNNGGSAIFQKAKHIPPPSQDPLTIAVTQIVDARIEQHDLASQVQECLDLLEQKTPTIKLEIPAWGVETKISDSHEDTPKIIAALACGLRPWLHGPAGSGKTTIAKDIAKALGREFITVSLSAGSTKSEATGFIGANGQYVSSRIRKAVEHGNCVLLIDEFDNSSGNLSTVLNTGLANKIWDFPDAQVEEHPTCAILIATNTNMRGGDMLYPERETQGAATIDRFVYFHIGYNTSRELQWALAINNSSECRAWVKTVQDLRKKCQEHSIQHVISPRASEYGAKLLLTELYTHDELLDALIYKGADANVIALIKGVQ